MSVVTALASAAPSLAPMKPELQVRTKPMDSSTFMVGTPPRDDSGRNRKRE
ncbi:hypothetical protein K377_03715 [Streptomyces sp. PsTaAH-137]|nr:hypothetical protein K377_03715 [Streptomyces sp. PsTaAH-137]